MTKGDKNMQELYVVKCPTDDKDCDCFSFNDKLLENAKVLELHCQACGRVIEVYKKDSGNIVVSSVR